MLKKFVIVMMLATLVVGGNWAVKRAEVTQWDPSILVVLGLLGAVHCFAIAWVWNHLNGNSK